MPGRDFPHAWDESDMYILCILEDICLLSVAQLL